MSTATPLYPYRCGVCGHEWSARENPDSCPRCNQVFASTQARIQAAALGRQEGGNHYKDMAIQPVEFIHKNGIGYFEGNVIKYVSRWRAKNGIEDLKKARHYIDLLIELEGGAPSAE